MTPLPGVYLEWQRMQNRAPYLACPAGARGGATALDYPRMCNKEIIYCTRGISEIRNGLGRFRSARKAAGRCFIRFSAASLEGKCP